MVGMLFGGELCGLSWGVGRFDVESFAQKQGVNTGARFWGGVRIWGLVRLGTVWVYRLLKERKKECGYNSR